MTDPNMTTSEAAGAQVGAGAITERDYYTNDRRQRALNAAIGMAQFMQRPLTIDDLLTNVTKIDAYLENGKAEETL